MKKIILECDSIVIDGIEITHNELKQYLTERIIFKKQLDHVRSIAQGSVTHE